MASGVSMRYRLYEQMPSESRNLYYPSGIDFMLDKLRMQASETGERSLSSYFLNFVRNHQGHVYITVPFDTADDSLFDNLEWGQFYVLNERSKSDERYHDEVQTVNATNIAFREQVTCNRSWIITECGNEPEGWDGKTKRRPPEFDVHSVFYRYIEPGHDEETTWDVLNDPTPRFRFLVAPPPPELTEWNKRLEYFALNVQCVALQIFDYMGYLLWFPKDAPSHD